MGDPAAFHPAGGDEYEPVDPLRVAGGETRGDGPTQGEADHGGARQLPVVEQGGEDCFQSFLVGGPMPGSAAAVAGPGALPSSG